MAARIHVIAGADLRLTVDDAYTRSTRLMPKIPRQTTAMPAKLSDPADWVDRYGDALLRYAGGRVASRELAEDLVQETFLAAFSHRSQFDGKSAFGTWLVAILRRKIVDHHRKSGRSPDLAAESLAAVEDPFTAKGKWTISPTKWRMCPKVIAENAEFWNVFQDCMSGLPMHLAQAFQMRELGMASVDDASRLTGITPKNLAVRLHRARLLLRQCLEKRWFRGERGGAS
jgi:RNA polymerase sigma-70 factor, ECF subfamily